MKRNEEFNAHSEYPLVPGIIVIIDLDKFREFVEKHGLDPYKPNIITSELTSLVELFTRKFRGVVIYGLDYERGTEEAVIEIPHGVDYLDLVISELKYIANRIRELGATLTAVIVVDYVSGRSAKSRRDAYEGTLGRRRALRALRRAKKKGGNRIIVLA